MNASVDPATPPAKPRPNAVDSVESTGPTEPFTETVLLPSRISTSTPFSSIASKTTATSRSYPTPFHAFDLYRPTCLPRPASHWNDSTLISGSIGVSS